MTALAWEKLEAWTIALMLDPASREEFIYIYIYIYI